MSLNRSLREQGLQRGNCRCVESSTYRSNTVTPLPRNDCLGARDFRARAAGTFGSVTMRAIARKVQAGLRRWSSWSVTILNTAPPTPAPEKTMPVLSSDENQHCRCSTVGADGRSREVPSSKEIGGGEHCRRKEAERLTESEEESFRDEQAGHAVDTEASEQRPQSRAHRTSESNAALSKQALVLNGKTRSFGGRKRTGPYAATARLMGMASTACIVAWVEPIQASVPAGATPLVVRASWRTPPAIFYPASGTEAAGAASGGDAHNCTLRPSS